MLTRPTRKAPLRGSPSSLPWGSKTGGATYWRPSGTRCASFPLKTDGSGLASGPHGCHHPRLHLDPTTTISPHKAASISYGKQTSASGCTPGTAALNRKAGVKCLSFPFPPRPCVFQPDLEGGKLVFPGSVWTSLEASKVTHTDFMRPVGQAAPPNPRAKPPTCRDWSFSCS